MRFTAILEPQAEGGYHAMCPTLPGCHSEGDTLDEAISNIRKPSLSTSTSSRERCEEFFST